MSKKEKRSLTGVARLRERFYQIKSRIKISPELEKATREKKPSTEQEENEVQKKIAQPKRDWEVDL